MLSAWHMTPAFNGSMDSWPAYVYTNSHLKFIPIIANDFNPFTFCRYSHRRRKKTSIGRQMRRRKNHRKRLWKRVNRSPMDWSTKYWSLKHPIVRKCWAVWRHCICWPKCGQRCWSTMASHWNHIWIRLLQLPTGWSSSVVSQRSLSKWYRWWSIRANRFWSNWKHIWWC